MKKNQDRLLCELTENVRTQTSLPGVFFLGDVRVISGVIRAEPESLAFITGSERR